MESIKDLTLYLFNLDSEGVGKNIFEIVLMAVYESIVEMIRGQNVGIIEFIKKLPKHFVDGVLLKMVSNKLYEWTIASNDTKVKNQMKKDKKKYMKNDMMPGYIHNEHMAIDDKKARDVNLKDFKKLHENMPMTMNRYYHYGGMLAQL